MMPRTAAKYHPGLFAAFKVKHGKGWLRQVDDVTRRDFGRIGMMYACQKTEYQFWSIGGRARAKNARRDAQGRFIK